MAETTEKTAETAPLLHVAPSPHLGDRGTSTRRMMLDVLIGLAPIVGVAIYVFQWYAVKQLGICILSCMAAESLFAAMRRRPISVGDLSAVITGVILALSLPGTAPWFVGVVGSFVAVGIGKMVFGGLGQNIFNPAMVGRAFVMIAFPTLLAASGYVAANSHVWAITQATPLTNFKQNHVVPALWDLFWGNTNGSLGETSAIAALVGGLYLCLRRTASWEIPFGVIATAGVIAGIDNLVHMNAQWTALHDLLGGALLFGAFFIATDPVTSPLTPKGKLIFGLCLGALVMMMRKLSGWPEGVMFSVLLMNAVTPLINRWTIPRPLGGNVPVRKPAEAKPAAKPAEAAK